MHRRWIRSPLEDIGYQMGPLIRSWQKSLLRASGNKNMRSLGSATSISANVPQHPTVLSCLGFILPLFALLKPLILVLWGFPGGSAGKESACNSGDIGAMGSSPGWGRSPEEGNGNPLQSSCLDNPVDRRAWWGYSPKGHRVGNDWAQAHSCLILLHYFSRWLLLKLRQDKTETTREEDFLCQQIYIYL